MEKNKITGAILAAVLLAASALSGCNMVKDTANTSVKGGENAGGIAKKMHNGTVGDADPDTGESKSDSSGSDSSGGGE